MHRCQDGVRIRAGWINNVENFVGRTRVFVYLLFRPVHRRIALAQLEKQIGQRF